MAGALDPISATDVDRRSVPRRDLTLGVTLRRVGGDDVIPAAIANLSSSGFLAEVPEGATLPEMLDVELPNAGRRKALVVWGGGTVAGCTFQVPLSTADLSAARLKSTRPQAVVDAETRAQELELRPDDPIWDVRNQTLQEEKLSPSVRVAVIIAAALASWVPVVGIAALLA